MRSTLHRIVWGAICNWRTTVPLAVLAAILGDALWILSGPSLTYAQALKHSNSYLLWHLALHIAALFAAASSFVLMVRLLLRPLARRLAAWCEPWLVHRAPKGDRP